MAFSSQKAKLLTFFQDDPELEVLWLYGSHAKNTAHKNSDIDLAITFKNWIDDPIERRLRPELLAVEWQRALGLNEGMLSILDMSIAPIPMAMSVLTTGELLQSKNKNKQFQEQQRIMSRWEIDYLYHYKNKKRLYG